MRAVAPQIRRSCRQFNKFEILLHHPIFVNSMNNIIIMNEKDIINNLDSVTLKDFVDNYNDIKTTLSTIKEKVKEID